MSPDPTRYCKTEGCYRPPKIRLRMYIDGEEDYEDKWYCKMCRRAMQEGRDASMIEELINLTDYNE